MTARTQHKPPRPTRLTRARMRRIGGLLATRHQHQRSLRDANAALRRELRGSPLTITMLDAFIQRRLSEQGETR